MTSKSSFIDKTAMAGSWLSTLLTMAVPAVLLAFLLHRSMPAWSVSLFFGETPPLDAMLHGEPVFDGIWPACVGTVALVALSTLIAIPLGVASGIYLAEYAHGRLGTLFSFCVDMLAGIPSVLIGLFGFSLLLLIRKTVAPDANTGLLLSALCLAILVLPYLVSTTRMSIAGLPSELRLTGASLGLSHNQVVGRILLPSAMPGIFSGVILAIGRAAEDTAVILLTGAVANAGTPGSLTGNYEALPFFIFYLSAEHQSPEELAQAFAAALVLLCLTGVMLGFARLLQARLDQKWKTGHLN